MPESFTTFFSAAFDDRRAPYDYQRRLAGDNSLELEGCRPLHPTSSALFPCESQLDLTLVHPALKNGSCPQTFQGLKLGIKIRNLQRERDLFVFHEFVEFSSTQAGASPKSANQRSEGVSFVEKTSHGYPAYVRAPNIGRMPMPLIRTVLGGAVAGKKFNFLTLFQDRDGRAKAGGHGPAVKKGIRREVEFFIRGGSFRNQALPDAGASRFPREDC